MVGSPTRRQKEIYSTVLEAQCRAVEKVAPGVPVSEIDKAARSVIRKAGFGKYFTHSTGHGVGVEVHEPPRLAPGNSEVLEAGYVVTVEPGIYIGGKGGARFESTVVLTPKGFEVLTPCTKPG